MKNIKIVQILLGIAALFLVAGCASQPHYAYDSDAANATLESTVRAEINRYGDLAAAAPDLKVYAKNGAVTLRGTVPTERERQMLDDVVRNTTGVVAVQDQLLVRYPHGVPPARNYSGSAPVINNQAPVIVQGNPPTTLTSPTLIVRASTENEQRIANKIIDQFHHDDIPSTSLQDVNITVDGGDVYLRGSVADPLVRQAALTSVRRISGVRTVFDELQVR